MENKKEIGLLITVCNEIDELTNLWEWINEWYVNPFSSICFLVDAYNTTDEVKEKLREIYHFCTNNKCGYGIDIQYYCNIHDEKLKFDDFKNFGINEMSRYCDYVFQLDVDETFTELLLEDLPTIIDENDVDLYLLPRENFVEGITHTDIARWNWQIDKFGRINYPDNQGRIFKSNLRFEGAVHERIVNYKTFAVLPEQYAIIHPKNIERQRKQNQKYAEY